MNSVSNLRICESILTDNMIKKKSVHLTDVQALYQLFKIIVFELKT